MAVDKSRQNSILLHRIRSGHNRLNKYQFRLDEGADPSCRFGCEVLEDAEHLIINCPKLVDNREKLASFFAKNKLPFIFTSVSGCDPDLDRITQLKTRDLLISFLKDEKIRHIF